MSWIPLKNIRAEKQQIAGREVRVLRGPRPGNDGTFKLAWKGLKGLLTGMKLTIGYFLRPSTIVTQQYPENRESLKHPDRYRGRLHFVFEDNGYHRCTACRICERNCPNVSIIIDAHKGEHTAKPEIDFYRWRLDTCTFCGICVQVCPFDAIRFDGQFESAVFDRRLLVYNLNNYAGPHDKLALKIEDLDLRANCRTAVAPYDGPLPVQGTAMDGIRPVVPKTPPQSQEPKQ